MDFNPHFFMVFQWSFSMEDYGTNRIHSAEIVGPMGYRRNFTRIALSCSGRPVNFPLDHHMIGSTIGNHFHKCVEFSHTRQICYVPIILWI